MVIAWYVLTVILGVFGVLAVLRAGDRLAFGGGVNSITIQMVIGFVCIAGAWKCLRTVLSKKVFQSPLGSRTMPTVR